MRRAIVTVGIALAIVTAARAPKSRAGIADPSATPALSRATESAAHVRARPDSPETARPEMDRAGDPSDDVARIEAIEALVARGHVAALDQLLAFDPGADPFVAPTAIEAIGAIGRNAPRAEKSKAALRLVALLASEKERRGQDSAGNVVSLVEAIGTLGDPAAAPALVAELDDTFHDTAGKTNIVEALANIGARSTVPALERLRDRVRADRASDPFQRELERELARAIDTAITKLL